MAEKDKDGKLTYKMTSAGEAWMNYVNSKEGHNAAAVTPAYLEENKDERTAIEKKIDAARSKKKIEMDNEKQLNVEQSKDR